MLLETSLSERCGPPALQFFSSSIFRSAFAVARITAAMAQLMPSKGLLREGNGNGAALLPVPFRAPGAAGKHHSKKRAASATLSVSPQPAGPLGSHPSLAFPPSSSTDNSPQSRAVQQPVSLTADGSLLVLENNGQFSLFESDSEESQRRLVARGNLKLPRATATTSMRLVSKSIDHGRLREAVLQWQEQGKVLAELRVVPPGGTSQQWSRVRLQACVCREGGGRTPPM